MREWHKYTKADGSIEIVEWVDGWGERLIAAQVRPQDVDLILMAPKRTALDVVGQQLTEQVNDLRLQLAAAHELINNIKQSTADACQSVQDEIRAGATFENIPLAISARIALAWLEIEREATVVTAHERVKEAGEALIERLERSHICPCCGFGTNIHGEPFHGTGCTLEAFRAVLREGATKQ